MKESIRIKHRRIGTALLFLGAFIAVAFTVTMLIYFRTNIVARDIMTDDEGIEYDRVYAFISRDAEDDFWMPVYEEMKAYGDSQGIYIQWMGRNITNDYDWHDLVEIATAAKVDGIILEADSSDECLKAINTAARAGVPVVTIRNDCPLSKRISYVGISYYNLGSEYGNIAMTVAKDRIRKEKISRLYDDNNTPVETVDGIKILVLIDKNSNDSSQNTTLLAIQEQFSNEYFSDGEVEIVTVPIDNDNDFSAEESVQDILRDPNLADIIICLNEVNTVSVYQSLVEHNQVGNTTIVGYSDSETVLKAIKKSIINSSITADVKQLGDSGIDALNEYLEYGRVSDYYSVNYTVINSGNVRQYLVDEEINEDN